MQEQNRDCHRHEELDKWLGKRVELTTTLGRCRGYLNYQAGWYFCNAGERWEHDQWIQSPYRFIFRKGNFRKIKGADPEKRGRR